MTILEQLKTMRETTDHIQASGEPGFIELDPLIDHLEQLEAYPTAVAEVRARYPENVTLVENGELRSEDSIAERSARLARLVCDQINALVRVIRERPK